MTKLSKRQQEILDFIKKEVREKGIHHRFVKLVKRLVYPPVQRYTVI